MMVMVTMVMVVVMIMMVVMVVMITLLIYAYLFTGSYYIIMYINLVIRERERDSIPYNIKIISTDTEKT